MNTAQQIKVANTKFFSAMEAAQAAAVKVVGTSTGGMFKFEDGSQLNFSCPYVEVVENS